MRARSTVLTVLARLTTVTGLARGAEPAAPPRQPINKPLAKPPT